MRIENLPRAGDMLAIPFFLWLVVYFYKKEGKTDEEKNPWTLLPWRIDC